MDEPIYIKTNYRDLDRILRAIKAYEKKREYARKRAAEKAVEGTGALPDYSSEGRLPDIQADIQTATTITANYLKREGRKAVKITKSAESPDSDDDNFSVVSEATDYTLNPIQH